MNFADTPLHEIDAYMQEAWKAFHIYRKKSLKERAAFMRSIAIELENCGDTLIQTAMRETHLPEARLRGERGRTIFQLNSYADACERGEWLEASIDTAIPDKVPAKPDIRKMLIPMGPVVVFGSSNFPFAVIVLPFSFWVRTILRSTRTRIGHAAANGYWGQACELDKTSLGQGVGKSFSGRKRMGGFRRCSASASQRKQLFARGLEPVNHDLGHSLHHLVTEVVFAIAAFAKPCAVKEKRLGLFGRTCIEVPIIRWKQP